MKYIDIEVKKGDTLYNIAEEIYGYGFMWRAIYRNNKDKIENPDLIQEGLKLKVPVRRDYDVQ